MAEKKNGMTRRDFLKTIGIGGFAATGFDAANTLAAPAQDAANGTTIPRRKLGKTGAEVSALALGGMFDTVNNQLLLRQARNWGVTYWDTAEGYGNGMSEEGFGRFFTRNPDARKEIFLVTKFRPAAPDAMRASIENSLKRLCTDHVDLFFLHGLNDFGEISDGARQWASEMKKAGKFRFFGFSTHQNMEDCLTSAARADWIDAVMFSYNFRLMQTTKMKEAIAACAAAGVGLVAMKTQGGGPVKSDSEAEVQMAGRFLDRGFTDRQAKLKAVWETPHIASICSQMPNLTILASNVAAARDRTSLARKDFEMLARFAKETREGYCAGCGRICREATGGEIPVSDVMRCLMYYRDYGERDLAREVFAAFPDEVRRRLANTDYSHAENTCPQGLAIAALMREASELFA